MPEPKKYKVTPKPRYKAPYCAECSNLATYLYKGNYYCGDCVLNRAVVCNELRTTTRYYTLDDTRLERGFDSITALKILEDRNTIKEIG